MESPPSTLERRDKEAFARYVVPELEVLLRVARSMTRSVADAEDLVQETLLRAYRGIARFDGEHPRAWLLTILRNTAINQGRRRRPLLLLDGDDGLERLAPTLAEDNPETIVMERHLDAPLEAAFAALPAKARQTVVLVDVHGLSYAEAARAIGIPVGTLMSRLHRARKRMRRRLEAQRREGTT